MKKGIYRKTKENDCVKYMGKHGGYHISEPIQWENFNENPDVGWGGFSCRLKELSTLAIPEEYLL